MLLTVIGCGDAFGSGGRLQTCFHVQAACSTFLIDCGASALIGLRRAGLQPNDIDAVFLTHLHGDHFGGLPWLLIDAQHVSRRQRPLTVTGPRGSEERFIAASEALYPGALDAESKFAFRFVDYEDGKSVQVDGVTVTAFEVSHPCGAPPYALRIEADGKVIAFTGDTEWVENLCRAACGADLLICESYQYDKLSKVHLDFKTIEANRERLGAKCILLTHLGEEMLAARDKVDASRYLIADDGMRLEI